MRILLCLLFIAAASKILLTACCILPVPHESWSNPIVRAKIVDTESGQVLKTAKILYEGEAIGVTDENGEIETSPNPQSEFWWVIFMDPAFKLVSIAVECDGYESVMIQRKTLVKSSFKPAAIDLGTIKLNREVLQE